MLDTPFDGVCFSSVAFSDIDGDGDEDLLIMGSNNDWEPVTRLYTNDGGNFTELLGTPFHDISGSVGAFSDVDGDGDKDLLITGEFAPFEFSVKLYTYDAGSFTEVLGNTFFPINGNGSITFSDIDNDSDEDVLIMGGNNPSERTAILYINDRTPSSIEETTIDFNLEVIPFPNPSSSNTLNISYPSTAIGEVQVKVYDVNGVLLKEHIEIAGIGLQSFSIDIASFAKGSYYIELLTDKRKGLARFIVQ